MSSNRGDLRPVVALLLLSASGLGFAPGPLAWSPDGRWLAYQSRSSERPGVAEAGTGILDPGFLGSPAEETPRRVADEPTLETRGIHRIWATREETGESVLLVENPLPMTAPSWNPNGSSIAFGRLVAGDRGDLKLEVVVSTAPRSTRAVASFPVKPDASEIRRLSTRSIAWSPDGRLLAVPRLDPPGLAIVRSDNGSLLRVVEGAVFPAWSPDGATLAYYRAGDRDRLFRMDADLGSEKMLADVGEAEQPPIWSSDSQSVYVLSRGPSRDAAISRNDQPAINRVLVASGRIERVVEPAPKDSDGREKTLISASFVVDRFGDVLLHAIDVEDEPSQIAWIRPKEGATFKRFPVIDPSFPITSLALSPTKPILALRLGRGQDASPPLLCRLENQLLTPLAPDDSSRNVWIRKLLGIAKPRIRSALERLGAVKGSMPRPALLPIPGEIEENSESAMLLRRIGRLGSAICDFPAGGRAVSAESRGFLVESRFVFNYLQENYSEAVDSLEALEEHSETPDSRRLCLGLRAQVYLGMGDVERARATLSFLKSSRSATAYRYEATLASISLLPIPDPWRDWTGYLESRANVVEAMLKDKLEKVKEAEDHVNPDAPQPGLGLDP